MTEYNRFIGKPAEDEPEQCTKEAAAKRQEQLDKDVAEFLAKGGKVTR